MNTNSTQCRQSVKRIIDNIRDGNKTIIADQSEINQRVGGGYQRLPILKLPVSALSKISNLIAQNFQSILR